MLKNRLTEFVTIIVSTGWWLLQMVGNVDERWGIVYFLFENKIWVGTLLGVFAILALLYDCNKGNAKRLKLHCNSIMKYISEKHFFTTGKSVRCTIFRPVGGKSLYLNLIWKLIIQNFFYNLVHWKFNESYIRIRQFVPDTSLVYLSIYSRYQHPKASESNIAFPISTRPRKYGSAVECCFKKGDIVEVHTVDISQIELPSKESDLKKGDKGKVKTYMEKSFISDYSTLHKMSTLANHIFAVPIILEDETTWGIMTIDFIGDEKVLGTEEHFPDLLKIYAKMISINIKYQ